MNKKRWIILISAVVAVALIAVLLVVILGGNSSKGQTGNGDTTGTSNVVEVGIDQGDEEIDDSMVIDFSDLLEAAGK